MHKALIVSGLLLITPLYTISSEKSIPTLTFQTPHIDALLDEMQEETRNMPGKSTEAIIFWCVIQGAKQLKKHYTQNVDTLRFVEIMEELAKNIREFNSRNEMTTNITLFLEEISKPSSEVMQTLLKNENTAPFVKQIKKRISFLNDTIESIVSDKSLCKALKDEEQTDPVKTIYANFCDDTSKTKIAATSSSSSLSISTVSTAINHSDLQCTEKTNIITEKKS